ncbi:MAG: hypothetical protein AB1Z98_09490, partial [Nannocystaceae bacterium]
MSEPVETGVVRALLRRARAASRRRTTARVLLDTSMVAVAATVAAALVAGWTLRGDLAAIGWTLAIGAGLTGLVLHAVIRGRRALGTDLTTARAIAHYGAPLGHADSPARAREHRLLRHELLAATELAEALAAGNTGPHAGSPRLAAHYIADVAHRLVADDVDARRALPGPRWRPRMIALAGLMVATVMATEGPLVDGAGLLVAGVDGRPPTPPEPVWSSMRLRLEYPPHTKRPAREVPNPSGALRVPAGTVVTLEMDARETAEAGRVVINYDSAELTAAPPPEVVTLATEPESLRWTGSFTVRATGTWTVVLLDDEDDELDDSARRSAALPLEQEPDRAPEIELMPLPDSRREVRETDRVEVRMVARDDFGLRSATLVYQMPDGEAHRLPLKAPAGARRWRARHDWDLSQIPVTERSEVLYWIEVRDNDPGLGLVPLSDPPGKLSRSSTQRLLVRDDESEHASNIVKLRDIRDLAVDLLAARMTTRAFPSPGPSGTPAPPPAPDPVRATLSRDLLHRGGQLLARLAEAIDVLSMDTLARERDVATLTEIHGRLAKLHAAELELHAQMPPGSEL